MTNIIRIFDVFRDSKVIERIKLKNELTATYAKLLDAAADNQRINKRNRQLELDIKIIRLRVSQYIMEHTEGDIDDKQRLIEELIYNNDEGH